MLSPLVCLVGFALWAVVLVLCIGAVRVTLVMRGEKRAHEFTSGTPHGGDRYWRLNRAHLNTLENLPIFATLVLAGTWLKLDSWAFATLPQVVLGARMVQSMVHVASGRNRVTSLRFAAFVVQVICFLWLAVEVVLSSVATGTPR